MFCPCYILSPQNTVSSKTNALWKKFISNTWYLCFSSSLSDVPSSFIKIFYTLSFSLYPLFQFLLWSGFFLLFSLFNLFENFKGLYYKWHLSMYSVPFWSFWSIQFSSSEQKQRIKCETCISEMMVQSPIEKRQHLEKAFKAFSLIQKLFVWLLVNVSLL